jgi:nucleoside-diphosphate-sugar epimerase
LPYKISKGMKNQNMVLVTGGTGFVGIHCILQLLQKGYHVKTTLRSLNRKNEVLDMLKVGGIDSFDHIEFIQADLTSDTNWDKAVENCDYVLHVASPIHLRIPKDENEMIIPAVEGTLRVLKAARDAGVKRVVMTSNFGAVGYSHKDKSRLITEESWTDPNEKGLSAYNKSKVLAERAAWDFIQTAGGNLELSVINPMGIFGPSLGPGLSSGFELLKKVLDGSMKRIPNITLGIVDVRDVADLHIRAMTSSAAKGQRFLALAGGTLSLPEIAGLLKETIGDATKHVSTKRMPDWFVRIAALFSPVARNVVPQLGRYKNASNEKAKTLLEWRPRSNEAAILSTAESLLKFGAVKIILLILAMFGLQKSFAQGTSQTIKGTVIDKQTQSAIPGVTITVIGENKGTVTDASGHFRITGISPGRYDISFSFMGYAAYTAPNVEVTSGKEVVLDVGLDESTSTLNEIVVQGGSKKHETINQLATVSGRSFTMEEVNRYSGGRSDPSRLVANFAGVSAPDDSRNDIVVRGNSPSGILWRIEGLNIPNPNHFSTIGTTGGSASALNTNILKNSDFLTSAFPAEYGNANAGVFDLGFRTGNTDKREHTIQLGALTGLEGMTEGPGNKAKGSSYVLAYRYSFTGLAQALGLTVGTASTPFYQDLSFKINSGDGKLGRFTLFGLGGTSNIDLMHDEVDADDVWGNPKRDIYFKSRIGLVGVKHFIRVSEKSYFNTVIGATYARTEQALDSIAIDAHARVVDVNVTQSRYSINTSFNTTISPKLFLKIGATEELMNVSLFYRDRVSPPNEWKQIWDFDGNTSLIQGYVHVKYNISDKLTANLGIHSQFLTLNNSSSIEPRIAFRYQLTGKSTLTAGFGMHSQMQPTDAYFYQSQNEDGTFDRSNEKLDFTRSQHYVLGYEILPVKNWRIKAEVYYQRLYNVPVSDTLSSYSMLNAGSRSNYYNEEGHLKNSGTGFNYGAELTIEKFFSYGYYGLLTGSLYQSKYEGSDGIERNTGFNGKYVYNILAGKEWKIGKGKKNKFSVDMKMTQAGGRYYTPVDYAASVARNREMLQGGNAVFSARNADFFRLDVKAGVTINSRKRNLSHAIFLDIQNLTDNKNVLVAERYNPATQRVNTAYQIGVFPNFVYRVQF